MKLWAVEFKAGNGRWSVDDRAIRPTKREAEQAALDTFLLNDATDQGDGWQQYHALRDAGRVRAVKVRIVVERGSGETEREGGC